MAANELLDNLAVRLVERGDGSWLEVRVGLDAPTTTSSRCWSTPRPTLAAFADEVADGAPVRPGDRLPVPARIGDWLATVAADA